MGSARDEGGRMREESERHRESVFIILPFSSLILSRDHPLTQVVLTFINLVKRIQISILLDKSRGQR